VRLHALVPDLESARRAVDAGATVVQLRVKDASTDELVEAGRGFGDLGVTFVVNDDVEAALALGADGIHLGQSDPGVDRALGSGLLVGLSVATRREAAIAEHRGAGYLGAGAIWPTPSKTDAHAIGLDALREICMSVSIPVVAIGGIDASNAAECIRAGAAGVAVIRAAGDPALRAALDAAL
jgi:thiamine-phosphate pyrophosphorylase